MDLDNPKTEKPKLTPLTLTSANGESQFDIEQETLVGREVECHVSLDSPHVSRYHAKIIVAREGASIEDLNSSNGTYVNGKRIKERTRISLGDEIRFDDLSFRLTSKDAGKSDATVVMNRDDIAAKVSASEPIDPKPKEQVVAPTQAAPAPAAEASTDTASEQDEDSTRMLSSDQISNIAEINKKLEKFTDLGSGPRFVATTAPIRGKVFELDAQQADNTWRFGRSRECELCVSAPSISRHHGTIRKKDGRFFFTSEPGKTLRVNGEEIADLQLKHNHQIQIGPIEFIFRLDEQEKASSRVIQETEPDNTLKQVLMIAGVGALILLLLFSFFLITK